VLTQLPFELNFLPGDSVDGLLDPFSGRQEDPEGTPPQRGFRWTRLLGFRWVAGGHAAMHLLAPAELERWSVAQCSRVSFERGCRQSRSEVHPGVPGHVAAPSTHQMTRPDAATAEAPWRGASPWSDARRATLLGFFFRSLEKSREGELLAILIGCAVA
jgi:hypothetical protein